MENTGLDSALGSVGGIITDLVLWLRLGIEVISVILIVAGAAVAVFYLGRYFLAQTSAGFNQVRLKFGRFLVLALEFQLAADILGTAVAPSWDHLGKLGAIAVIRTFLSFFLAHEMKEEENALEAAAVQAEARK